MEGAALQVENLFHEKIFLYRDLVETLKSEKESIKEIDVEALWKFSHKKQAIVVKIQGLRQQILDELDQLSIVHDMNAHSFRTSKLMSKMPHDMREKLQKINVSLITLKDEANLIAKENKAFVLEYLGVMDELMGAIFKVKKTDHVYSNKGFSLGYQGMGKQNGVSVLVHRQV